MRNKEGTRRINQYDLDGHYIRTFDSIADAKRLVPGTSSLAKVLAGKKRCKSAGGYQWKYYNGNCDDIEPIVINSVMRPILQIDPDTDEVVAEFPSIAEAAKALNIKNKAHISQVCNSTRKHCEGFKFRYKKTSKESRMN